MQILTQKLRNKLKEIMRIRGGYEDACQWRNVDGMKKYCAATSHWKKQCSTECRFFEPGTFALLKLAQEIDNGKDYE